VLNRIFVSMLCVGLLIAGSRDAAAQARDTLRDHVSVMGMVTGIDRLARTVTIRGADGNVVTLDVPSTVVRFDQIRVGDTITVQYYDRVNVRMKAPGEPPVDRTVAPVATPTPGMLPGAVYAAQRIATVTVTAWDPVTRTVSFTSPDGATYTRHLSEEMDPSGLRGLMVGDRVDVTWTEAVDISMQAGALANPVTPAGPPAVQPSNPPYAPPYAAPYDDPEDFLHRFTISAMLGWDNQFSGKFIQAATGATTGGVPIELFDSSFDDVYGRIGMFKIGVGYRTSPRSEVAVNFVVSSSGADNPIDIGNTTAFNVPLFVNFDDYSYWGFEGGQRFFFSRVRFTPYVGYLVGLNRFDDLHGVFVDVPASATPGLVDQEGKFFESSWAFSFGPTGGVLVGIGPVEVMAETQLRYMGGLSDVDWLVEEGLRDINSESSRWSLPIMVGARFRF
jgi:hypothetical protein